MKAEDVIGGVFKTVILSSFLVVLVLLTRFVFRVYSMKQSESMLMDEMESAISRSNYLTTSLLSHSGSTFDSGLTGLGGLDVSIYGMLVGTTSSTVTKTIDGTDIVYTVSGPSFYKSLVLKGVLAPDEDDEASTNITVERAYGSTQHIKMVITTSDLLDKGGTSSFVFTADVPCLRYIDKD